MDIASNVRGRIDTARKAPARRERPQGYTLPLYIVAKLRRPNLTSSEARKVVRGESLQARPSRLKKLNRVMRTTNALMDWIVARNDRISARHR